MFRSRNTTAGGEVRIASRPAPASAASSTEKPSPSRTMRIASRIVAWSSITRIRAPMR